MSIDVYLAN